MTTPITLAQILERMQALDETMAELDPVECDALAQSLEIKVDGYRAVINRFESLAAEVAADIAQLEKKKKAYVNRAKNLEYLLVRHMLHHRFEQLPGQEWTVKLHKSESVEIDVSAEKPDAGMYRLFREFMRRSYTWDKLAIKAGIAAGSFAHDNIRIKTNYSPVFGPRKEE